MKNSTSKTLIALLTVTVLLLLSSSALAASNDKGFGNSIVSQSSSRQTLASSDPVVYVSDLHGNDANDGTSDHPMKTVQAGISRAATLYDVAQVHVAEGTYDISDSSIQLVEGISILGGFSQDWTHRDVNLYQTVIDDNRTSGGASSYPNYAIKADADITTDTIVDGFTINGGGGDYSTCILASGSPTISNNILNGGTVSEVSQGIFLQNDASPIIHNNTIYGGTSVNRAQGIYANNYNEAIITNNEIDGGSTTNGTVHAIYGRHASLYIANNSLYGGHCVSDQCYSCGIREAAASNSTIINNVIVGGTGYRAYGILTSDGSNPKIYNNSINAGNAPQTATGIYIKNDDNPRIINNIIFTSGGEARFCIYENDPGSFPGHPNPDSNPGILRNNNLYDCPTALLSWFNEENTSWHAVTDLYTTITTAEDGEGTMAEWDNISEDLSSVLDEDLRFTGDLDHFTSDTGGRNGAHSEFNLGFSTDKDGFSRSPIDNSQTVGWSMGAYEYDSGFQPYASEDINQDLAVDSLDIQLCVNVLLDVEKDPLFVERSDVNMDGVVNGSDILQVAQKASTISHSAAN